MPRHGDGRGLALLSDFQRNSAFVGFMALVCLAAFLFITQKFRSVLIPLVWSAFFAVPICGLIQQIDQFLIFVASKIKHRSCVFKGVPGVMFTAEKDEKFIRVERSSDSELHRLLRGANMPCGPWSRSCCRRRVKIVEISAPQNVSADASTSLVQGWQYYICELGETSEDLREISGHTGLINDQESGRDQGAPRKLVLSLDRRGKYPVQSNCPRSGRLELDRSSPISWTIASAITLLILFFSLWLFVWFITLGVSAVMDNFHLYQTGVQQFMKEVSTRYKKYLPQKFWDAMQSGVDAFVRDGLPALIEGLVGQSKNVAWEGVLFVIYLLFWIFEPLPISAQVEQVFKSYLLLKTLVCALFATLISLTLWCLGCPLWPLFFVVTFALNYIPEVGAIMSAILTAPAVLFDGHIADMHVRIRHAVELAICFTIFKIICGNIIEVRLYATRGGQFMRMHPVILMATMMMCSAILGITGMFLAVPIMAVTKYFMIVGGMPAKLLSPLLTVFEGDDTAPYRNYVDLQTELELRSPLNPSV
eukprot:CAMPEP_0115438464 /NCGR_PEP_ID=MMETSP0271-20121206/35270_1 /TAXON_ID=71861 /ORGANISM="Scrippsiella trochoidea, Strain CCMP3099" /LENGTH=533 /DNA_ID=CAMNT_0002864117 /DNA_START=27 /DNA_END=1628 /DNA_ORIENTATION=-